jgi:hypothetical protein
MRHGQYHSVGNDGQHEDVVEPAAAHHHANPVLQHHGVALGDWQVLQGGKQSTAVVAAAKKGSIVQVVKYSNGFSTVSAAALEGQREYDGHSHSLFTHIRLGKVHAFLEQHVIIGLQVYAKCR